MVSDQAKSLISQPKYFFQLTIDMLTLSLPRTHHVLLYIYARLPRTYEMLVNSGNYSLFSADIKLPSSKRGNETLQWLISRTHFMPLGVLHTRGYKGHISPQGDHTGPQRGHMGHISQHETHTSPQRAHKGHISPHVASTHIFIDRSALGGYYGQYYASCLHIPRTIFMVPMLG